jgi:hypothetical protein
MEEYTISFSVALIICKNENTVLYDNAAERNKKLRGALASIHAEQLPTSNRW